MQSHVRLGHHPTHPMLVMFPTAMFPLLVLMDILRWYFRADLTFWSIGFWLALVGAIMTLVSMAPGIVDLAAIPDGSAAHRTAIWHTVNGTLVLVLFLAALAIRWPPGGDDTRLAWATVVDVLGLLAVAGQGWLGGELVYKHQIGVLTREEGGDPVVLRQAGTARSYVRADARRPGAERP